MAEVKLTQIRGGHKATITRLLGIVFKCIDDENFDEESKARVEDGIAEIKHQMDIIENYDGQILTPLKDEKVIANEIQDSSTFRVKARRGIREGEKFIHRCQGESNLGGPPQGRSNNTHSVKLPCITLTKFSGDPLEWPAFWDLFKTSIHERTDIGAAAKFHYLISQLEGDAAMLLADFDHTENAYGEAIKLMLETYGKPKLLVQARLNALFDLEPPLTSASSLSRFRSQYEGHLRGLRGLGSNITEAGYVFAAIIIRKLPSKIVNNINRASDGAIWDLESLRKAIVAEIGHLNVGDDVETCVSSSQQSRTSNYHSHSYPEGNSSTIMTANSSVNRNGNIVRTVNRCLLCSDNHSVFYCSKYRSVDSKRKRAKEFKLCYNCLRDSHSVSSCNNQNSCKNCHRRHHTVLCNRNIDSNQSNNVNINGNKINVTTISSNNDHSTMLINQSQILPTATLTLTHDNNSMACQTLFDTGSQRTFLSSSVVKKLNLPIISTCNISINGFNACCEEKTYNIVKCNYIANNISIEFEAIAVEKMPLDIVMPGRGQLIKKLRNNGVVLADHSLSDNCTNLSIVVGVDNYFKFAYGQSIDENVHLIPTRIGNLICGNIKNNTQFSSNVITTLFTVGSKLYDIEDSSLNEYLPKLWDLESVGIGTPSVLKFNDPAMSLFNQTIRYETNKYIVSLPWKENHPPLPSNQNLAIKRLNSLLHSLRKNPEKLNHYNKVMNDQVDAGFVEKLSDETVYSSLGSKIHYLSHHAVFKDSPTSPLRVVFNCSAKLNKNSPSLNECLHSGPSLINELCEVILRFRLGRYACSADIAKAFLQVGLNEADRDSTRFLWPEDVSNPESRICTFRFKVVLFGSTSSSFLLNATVMHHLNSINCDVSKLLKRNIYVDNIQNVFCTEEDICNFYERSKVIMSSAGFPLREWYSNSAKLNAVVSENKDAPIRITDEPKILGIKWNTKSDHLCLETRTFISKTSVSKRFVVSECAKIFDPLGIFLPVSIKCRIFMQKLWREKLDWDQDIPNNLLNEWINLCKDLNKSHEIKIKRQLTLKRHASLHIFSDSSKSAYGTVAYICDGTQSNFLFAKARVVPLKPVTLPQLELTAVTFAARLGDFLVKTFIDELNFSKIVIWSDSTIALSWLFSSKTLKPYVSQRVSEIHSLLPNAEFKHIDSKSNPADLLTRGVSFASLVNSDLWFDGPACIFDNNSSMYFLSCDIDNSVFDCEQVTIIESLENKLYSNFPLDITKYNSFCKLIMILSYVLKFIKMKCRSEMESNEISVGDLRNSEELLIKYVQFIHYREVINYFTGMSRVAPSVVHQLNLIFVDGIIRCKGRLVHSSLSESCKTPILLHYNSYFSKLLIMHIHRYRLHSGVSDVLATLRQKYWIPKARQKIKSLLRKCVICLKVQGKPYSAKEYAPLPVERVTQTLPFQVTGLDYTGALYVRNSQGNIVKCYILLYTCAVSRAVHLELVCNCNEEDFIDAFRRFVARRGYPSIIISDNASTFVCASKTFEQISKLCKIRNYCLNYGIEWKFITKRAPWAGGFYERLVGLTKTALKKTLGNALVTFFKLQTLITEIESILNDRPLMYVSNDLTESEPLTPSLLLYGHRLRTFPDVVELDNIIDSNFNEKVLFTEMSNKCIVLLQKFWERWSREYLTALRERHFNQSGKNSNNLVQVGTIVQVHDSTPRNKWKLGVITKLLYSRDNLVRSVELRMSNGLVTNRAIVKLYPLEVTASDVDSLVKPMKESDVRILPLRNSARVAKNNITEQCKNL